SGRDQTRQCPGPCPHRRLLAPPPSECQTGRAAASDEAGHFCPCPPATGGRSLPETTPDPMTDTPSAGRRSSPPPPPDPAPAAGGEHRFPCATCGAEMRYAPGTDSLTCDHCGASRDIPGAGRGDRAARELDYQRALRHELS